MRSTREREASMLMGLGFHKTRGRTGMIISHGNFAG